MTDAEAYAYRTILYRAMLEIRSRSGSGHPEWWNLAEMWRAQRFLKYSGALCNWLHNLAEFSRRDFEGFDTSRFWAEFADLEKKFASMTLAYRKIFDDTIATYDPNNR